MSRIIISYFLYMFILFELNAMILLLDYNAQIRCACPEVPLLSREMRGALINLF